MIVIRSGWADGWFVGLTCVLLLCGSWAFAQSPVALAPLRTEPARVLGNGTSELTLGFAYYRNERFPLFTTPAAIRSQDRFHLPILRFRVGIGSRVEIDAQHELLYLNETSREGLSNEQYGTGDAQLHTKVLLFSETEHLPAVSFRFGTKLPNANRNDRLGTDEMDFDVMGLLAKDLGAFSLHANLGIALVGNPGSSPVPGRFPAGGQDDLFVYALALATRPLFSREGRLAAVRLLTEFQGWTGSRFANDRSRWSFGMRYEANAWSGFLGVSVGTNTGSEDVGVRAGVERRFDLSFLFAGE